MIALVALALTAALTGCAARRPSEPPGITGRIQQLTKSDGGVSMLVVAPQDASNPVGNQAMVNVGARTPIRGIEGAKLPASALQTGVTVRVWFTGPVAESYPVQGTAAYVEVEPVHSP